jgi:hypothetical protein
MYRAQRREIEARCARFCRTVVDHYLSRLQLTSPSSRSRAVVHSGRKGGKERPVGADAVFYGKVRLTVVSKSGKEATLGKPKNRPRLGDFIPTKSAIVKVCSFEQQRSERSSRMPVLTSVHENADTCEGFNE